MLLPGFINVSRGLALIIKKMPLVKLIKPMKSQWIDSWKLNKKSIETLKKSDIAKKISGNV